MIKILTLDKEKEVEFEKLSNENDGLHIFTKDKTVNSGTFLICGHTESVKDGEIVGRPYAEIPRYCKIIHV